MISCQIMACKDRIRGGGAGCKAFIIAHPIFDKAFNWKKNFENRPRFDQLVRLRGKLSIKALHTQFLSVSITPDDRV